MSKSIIKESEVLRKGLQDRFKELKLTLKNVIEDAEKYDVQISSASLSKYLNKSPLTNLTEEVIVWLSFRYGIYVNVIIGNPQIVDDKFTSVIIPYDEERCIRFLKKKYGYKEKVAVKQRVSKRTVKAG
jgi:hypothetical protein